MLENEDVQISLINKKLKKIDPYSLTNLNISLAYSLCNANYRNNDQYVPYNIGFSKLAATSQTSPP